MHILVLGRLHLSARGRAVSILAACVALLSLPGLAHAQTVVSLTFDDGIASQNFARDQLAAHGFHGTFFINSGNVGTDPYFMSWSDVDTLAAQGNEIGGHTINHVRLTLLTADEQRHQICDDAAALRAHGYTVTDFAYPFGVGSTSPTVRSALTDCGFESARKYGDLNGPDCTDCPFLETIPPANPYGIKTGGFLTGPLTLTQLQTWVTQAEDHGGGWVPLVFHDICDGCDDSSVSQPVFQAFLDWLQARAANGTVVRTIRQVIEGAAPLAPDADLVGLDYVRVTENGFGDLAGRVGSNGAFNLKSCATPGSASNVTWDPGPNATVNSGCGAVQQAVPARAAGWTLAPVDGLIGFPNTADPANNDNASVFANAPGFKYAYDPAKGIRDLGDSTDTALVLDGPNPRPGSDGIWTFNFCRLVLSSKSRLTLRNGAVARFFVDSSQRPGSQCATAGALKMSNVVAMNYGDGPGNPSALQYYVEGGADIAVTNKASFAARLYAPLARLKFSNKTVWSGSLAAKSVEATNGLDFSPGS